MGKWLIILLLFAGCTFGKAPQGDVVMLLSPKSPSGGTGFELRTADGHEFTVTNDHVCELAQEGVLYATSEEGDRT